MLLTYLKRKLGGDNSMSGKPCEPEVGYGKNQGGQGCLRLRPYCFRLTEECQRMSRAAPPRARRLAVPSFGCADAKDPKCQ